MRSYSCLYVIFLIIACKNQATTKEVNDEPTDSVYYAYSPSYTSGYKSGDNKKVKIVSEIWKELENGDIKKTAGYFADEVNFVFPDQAFKGKKDSVLTEVKKIRDSYQSVQTFVYSWMPARSKDHNEDWVFIWGKNYLTSKNGKLQVIEIHEIWQFNEEGKIKFVQQYRTKPS
jgi:hypothetical protein